ncbi:Uncharacterised protein [Cedecea neteri]|uniref:Lipoprotein n=1 Tax=Cedecea neteri TaxID=158822 RepID=A0A291DU61_9ENTR|nr:hypothetical protein [Cedecea neteri]ATF91327.1 hypothetical protein CO704_04105 [Cedecea neteri]SQA99890.1 Uncharacterised protein [Cedecea neteri]
MNRYSIALLASACLLAACTSPQSAKTSQIKDLNAPQTIAFAGKTYGQSFTRSTPQQAVWEYTTDGEKAENWAWTRLITVNQLKINATLDRWMQATVVELNRTTPKPHYSVVKHGDVSEVRIINLPKPGDARQGGYESDVWIAREACGGIVNLQFARQYPADAKVAENDMVKRIKADNDADMTALQALNWKPECR